MTWWLLLGAFALGLTAGLFIMAGAQDRVCPKCGYRLAWNHDE